MRQCIRYMQHVESATAVTATAKWKSITDYTEQVLLKKDNKVTRTNFYATLFVGWLCS